MAFWTKRPSEMDDDEIVSSDALPEATVIAGIPESRGVGDSNDVIASSSDSNSNSDDSNSGSADIEEKIAMRFGGKLRSVLSAGTIIQGKLSFDTPVKIDGKLSGELYSSRALIVGKTGQIEASVQVQSLIVLGRIKGKIVATERLEILPGGVVEGEVHTASLSVDGGVLNGTCSMDLESPAIDSVAAQLKTSGPVPERNRRSKESSNTSSSEDSTSSKNTSIHNEQPAA